MANRLVKVIGVGTLGIMAAVLGACGDDDDPSAGSEDTAVESEDSTTTTAPEDAEDPAADGGADDGDTDSTGDVDACGILASLDLDGLLGQPAGEPEDGSSSMGAACSVEPADGSGGMSLAITPDDDGSNYERQLDTLGADAEVDGFGDKAFHSGGFMFVLDGDTMVRLQVIRDASIGSAAVPQEEMQAAMTTVLAAL